MVFFQKIFICISFIKYSSYLLDFENELFVNFLHSSLLSPEPGFMQVPFLGGVWSEGGREALSTGPGRAAATPTARGSPAF